MLTVLALLFGCSAVGALVAADSGKSVVLGASLGAFGPPGLLLLAWFLPPGPGVPPDEIEW